MLGTSWMHRALERNPAAERADDLRRFLHRGGWAIISAERPQYSAAENAERTARLKARLDALGAALPRDAKYRISPAVGVWDGREEASWLVYGLGSDVIRDLGREFEQYAVIAADEGANALLWTASAHTRAKSIHVGATKPEGGGFTRIEIDGTPLYIVIDFT